MRTRLVLATLLCAALASTPASAAVIFKQTFDGALGANESLGGRFQLGDGHVGHLTHYESNEYSFYQVALDLTEVTSAMLSFDFDLLSELHYDGFNVLGSTSGVFNSSTDLLTPITAGVYDQMSSNFARLGRTAASGDLEGKMLIDLSQFAGQTVNLRFQFQSDRAGTNRGVWFDNVAVTGAPIGSAVPEPATWAMMIAGFGLAGAAVRKARRHEARALA